LENPVTQGFLCPRGVADPKRVYSKDRVLYPYVKIEKKKGRFERISWDEAIQVVVRKLRQTIEQQGNGSVLFLNYPGNQGFLAWQYPERLWSFLGATKHDGALCSTSGHEGICLHYGLSYGVQLENLLGMKSIIFWGYNAKVASPHQWSLSLEARKEKGTKIIAVDPRKSPTAEASDLWLNPLPGTDVALAYGLARYLIEKDYVNKDFIDKWTVGFNKYKQEAFKWNPDRVKKVTGIDWNHIEELGESLAENQPAAFMIGLGLNKSLNGAESTRAVSLLPALLGYHRGFHYSDSKGRFVDWNYLNGREFASKKTRIVSQVALGPMLEAGEFKFVFVSGTNPAVTLPNQNLVRKGLSRPDVFVVVHDTHWTETGRLADVVLPAATYLEKADVVLSDHHRYCRLSNKIVEPLGESKSEIFLMHEFAKGLGLAEKFLFEEPWEALRKALEFTFENGSVEDLLKGKVAKLRLRSINEYQTSSAKIEFYSSKALEMGIEPLPEQLATGNSPDGWFVLLNSSLPNYTHSQFTDIYGPIPQIVWVNPMDSMILHIKNGEKVHIYNESGGIILQALVTEKVPKGVLWAPRPVTGIDGNPLNKLVSSTFQTIGKGPAFNTTRVKLMTTVQAEEQKKT
jgi:anaerobic selenocysteine-containing dehydrogenase